MRLTSPRTISRCLPYNDPVLAEIVQQHNAELTANCQLAPGRVVEHPEHGRVVIISGAFLRNGRVSNHWYWQRIGTDDIPRGPRESGYGWM